MIIVPHPTLRDAVVETLSLMQPGWEYIEASDLAHARVVAAARPFDIALVDAGFVGVTEGAAIDAIRAMAPEVRIVLLTDAEQTGGPAAGIPAGAHACVRKRNLFAELEPLLPQLIA